MAREQPRHRSAPGIVLAITCAGVFIAALDSTVVGVVPQHAAVVPRQHAGRVVVGVNSYGIALAAFVVPAGRLVDLMGRRKMFTVSVAGFTLTSAVCAAAPTVGILIAARTAQGIAAATLVPASLALAVEAHPGPARTHAVSVWSATLPWRPVRDSAWSPAHRRLELAAGVCDRPSRGRRTVVVRPPAVDREPRAGKPQPARSVGGTAARGIRGRADLAFIQAGTDGRTDPAVIVIAAAAVVGLVAFGRRCRRSPRRWWTSSC